MAPWKVLVVSHDKTVARRLRSILPDSRYDILPVVSDSASAAGAVQKKNPDVVVVQMTLKGTPSGPETALRISRLNAAPVIVLAEPSDRKNVAYGKEIGSAGFIHEPFDAFDTRSVMETAIARFETEQQLKEQRRWLDTTLRSIGDAVIATDKKGSVKFMNTIAESLTGWREEEAIGKKLSSVFTIISEETGKKLPDPVARVIAEKKALSLTDNTVLRSRSGIQFSIEDSAAPIFEENGDIAGVVLTFRDATEKRRVQNALNNNERRYRALIEKSAEAVSILNAEGTVLYTSPAMTAILGYATHEYVGRNAFEFVHPEEMEYNTNLFRRILSEPEKGISSQLRFLHKNGSWRWLEATSTNLLRNPSVEGIVINFRDISYRKEAEEKLNHINKRLDLIARVTGEVIGTLPIQKQVSEMAELVRSAFQVDAVIVRILEGENLVLLASTGVPRELIRDSLSTSEGIAQKILDHRRAVAYSDIRREFSVYLRQKEDSGRQNFEFISYAGAPMLIGHTIIGIIGIYTTREEREFTKTDLEHLQVVANHISVAVANNRLFREIREQNVEMTQHIEEQTRVERLLRVSEDRYRAFVEQSSEGIYRTAFDQPIPTSLPVDEQIRLMFERGYIAECNDEMAKMYGFSSIEETIGRKISDLLVPTDPYNVAYMNTFITNGYKFFDQESHEVDKNGQGKYFLNNGIGIVEEGQWWGVWGTQRDITERKTAERALRESEERYRALVEYSPNAIAVHVKGVVQFVNQAAVALVGATSVHQLVGTNVIDFVHPDYRGIAAERIARVYGNEAAPAQEQKWVRLDGSVVDVEVVSIPFLFEGEPAAQIIAKDITERKQAEDALRESELRFRSLFENAKDAVFIADIKTGVIIDANAEAEKLVKRPRSEIIGMHQSQLHPPERVDEALSIFREQMLMLGEHPVEFEVIDSFGNHIPVEIKASVIRLDEHRIVFQGMFRDITERKYAEEALRKSEEKYRALFEGSKDGIYISTYYGKFIDVNPAMVELLGYGSKDELLNLDIQNSVYYHPSDREKFKRAIEDKSYIKDLEVSLRRKDGTEVNVLLTATVERGADGSPLFYSGTLRDITERKRLEQQLIQAQKMESIGTLAGGIAHDFNNLLAMILGTAELIKNKSADNPKIVTYINRIIEASDRGASISKQLLLFSRPEQAELQPVSMTMIVEQLREFLSHFLPKNITIEYTPHHSSAVFMGDNGHIHQALVNLAINARDAMPDGGTLSIRVGIAPGETVRSIIPTADDHEYISVSIKDTGAGMSPQVVSRIFEPFFSTKERGKGTGLGLAIVHGIVKLHHGHVHVASEVGQGTTFTLFFPSLSIDIADSPSQQEFMKQNNHGSILIVDDEEILREILVENLVDIGYDVIAASNGSEALNIYQQQGKNISVIITDLGMPIMNGEQLFDKLKELNPHVKVIVSSGFLDSSNKSELLRKGIKDVLTKPFKFDVIQETVRKVLTNE